MTIVAISGYFDPIHVGHLDFIEKASDLGTLIVIVNNDKQAIKKKGKSFMSQEDRLKIINSLRDVDSAFISIDKDSSVSKTLEVIRPDIFANGGDRNFENSPETKVCKKLGIRMVDGLGKKIRSSSEMIRRNKFPMFHVGLGNQK